MRDPSRFSATIAAVIAAVFATVFAGAAVTGCGASPASTTAGADSEGGVTGGAEVSGALGLDDGVAVETRCTVRVEERGEEQSTTTYAFTDGVLTEVVAADSVSGRTFTTRYTWNEARSVVEVEKSSDQDGEPAASSMRYEGAPADGRVIGERLDGDAIVERITWWFDAAARPLKRNHEWLPTTADRTMGLEGRAEGDVCRYDDAGRPVAFDMSLIEEHVLEVRYVYEGNSTFPRSISERHMAEGDAGGAGPTATVDVESEDPADLTVVWANAPARATRYQGDCEAVFFPSVCSAESAPGR